MVTEFEAQLLSLTIDKERLALLAKDVSDLVAELSSPRNLKDEVNQRNRRRAMVEQFCATWTVTNMWVNDLVDRYEGLVEAGQGHVIRVWLVQTAQYQKSELPLPRVEPGAYPALKLA
jgi:hypothetical protein